MKQKIRFRMRYTNDLDSFAIAPKGIHSCGGWLHWYVTTGLQWWPVCGRVSQ